MAPTEEECRSIGTSSARSSDPDRLMLGLMVLSVEAVKQAGVLMAVGHVMRYTRYSRKIKQIGWLHPLFLFFLHKLLSWGHSFFFLLLLPSPYQMIAQLSVESGALGELVSIQHLEPVGWFHFAHSYVRGADKSQAHFFSLNLTHLV